MSDTAQSPPLCEVHTEDLLREGPRKYKQALSIMAGISILIIIIGFIPGFIFKNPWWFGSGAYAVILWVLASIRIVQLDELGFVSFFGSPIKELTGGPVFVPRFLCMLEKVTANIINVEFPDEPENVFKGPDDQFDHASGQKRPIRITAGVGAAPKDADTVGVIIHKPLETQMTAEVQIFVRWRVKSPASFIRNIGTIAEANKQLRDTCERVLIELAGKRTMGKIVKDTAKINKALFEGLVEIMARGGWGAELEDVGMKEPDLTHELNQKLADVAESRAEAAAKANRAVGKKAELVLTGEGEAQAALDLLKARADGMQAIMKKTEVSGEAALVADIGPNLLKDGDTVVLGGDGLGQLTGAAALIQNGLRKTGDDKKGADQ